MKWKTIKGYEGLYEVSERGDIKSLVGWNGRKYVKRNKLLKCSTTSTGYKKIELVKNGKRKSLKVHRLVAAAFIPNPDNLPVINHIDGDPLNNDYRNLEWCTQKYNTIHAVKTGLKKVFDVEHEDLEKLYVDEHKEISEIAKIYGVSRQTMSRIIKRHGLSKRGRKYDIDIEKLVGLFKEGLSNKEIADIFGCDNRLIATRRYQYNTGRIGGLA